MYNFYLFYNLNIFKKKLNISLIIMKKKNFEVKLNNK